jgi:hypothetical protein
MIGALTVAGMGLLLVASPSKAEEDTPPTRTFSCQLFHTDREAGRPIVREDVKIVQSGSLGDSTGRWTMSWLGQPPVTAQPFETSFGSIGGSVGIRWTAADGKRKKAFISFSDVHSEDGKIYFWLSLDRPSLWQPPGYGCESRSTEPSGAKS